MLQHTATTYLLRFVIRLEITTMSVRDYEYYEARAKDVKLEDITSDEHSADVLARLRDNDPEFTTMSIDDEDADLDL